MKPYFAPFRLWVGTDGGGLIELNTVSINQQLAPNDLTDSGAVWEDLGGTYTILVNTLVVDLTDAAEAHVAGVRDEQLPAGGVGGPSRGKGPHPAFGHLLPLLRNGRREGWQIPIPFSRPKDGRRWPKAG